MLTASLKNVWDLLDFYDFEGRRFGASALRRAAWRFSLPALRAFRGRGRAVQPGPSESLKSSRSRIFLRFMGEIPKVGNRNLVLLLLGQDPKPRSLWDFSGFGTIRTLTISRVWACEELQGTPIHSELKKNLFGAEPISELIGNPFWGELEASFLELNILDDKKGSAPIKGV